MTVLLINIVATATVASAIIGLIALIFSVREHKVWLVAVAVLFFLAAATVYVYEPGQENEASASVVPDMTQEEPAPEQSIATVSQHGLDVAVLGCQPATPGIACQLSVTSQEKAQELTAYASSGSYRSEAYPGDGNDYVASHVTLGSVEGKRYAINKLMPDEPMNMVLRFADVPQEARQLTTLSLSLRTNKGGMLEDVIFKNVPIEK